MQIYKKNCIYNISYKLFHKYLSKIANMWKKQSFKIILILKDIMYTLFVNLLSNFEMYM